jgi:hypothetical protein
MVEGKAMVMIKNLCDNPHCSFHCYVERVEEFGEMVWRFASGFQTKISKHQLLFFNPEEPVNFCQTCQEARAPLLKEIAKLTDSNNKLYSMVSPFTVV